MLEQRNEGSTITELRKHLPLFDSICRIFQAIDNLAKGHIAIHTAYWSGSESAKHPAPPKPHQPR